MTTTQHVEKRSQARLTPDELVLELRGRHEGGSNERRTALLILQLNRSDRLHALARSNSATEALREIAKRVRGILRKSDRFCFVTPDEVWLLLCDLPSEALAELAGKTLRESLMRPINIDKDDESTTVIQLRPVIGGCWAPGGAVSDPMTVVNAAASAAVRARNSDEHVLVTKLDSDAAIIHRASLERELRAALYSNELDVYFQPQINLMDGKCVAVEALIRWHRADGRPVNPQLIASVCEERGMMAQLTQYVLNTALRHQMFWRTQGIDVSVGINLSAVTLSDSAFPALVGQALSTWNIPGDKLLLELTESSIVQHEVSAIEFMRRLKEHGCKLAIDDFGTGYSSFSYLRQFPLDELKVDQSFVRNIATDQGDRQIVSALIDLAHTFEMHALAEGVEQAESLKVLEELGCDRAQGYHYARAMPPGDFAGWYAAYNTQLAEQKAGSLT